MDLSDKEDLLWLSELVRDVRHAAPAFNPLLVGAMARDLLLHYGHAVPIARATKDVDLAFAVASWTEFNTLRSALIDSGTFTATRLTHRFLHRQRTATDLIPFGGVEAPNGTITWPADEHVMEVLGYSEALATAVELLLPASQRISTPSLPMLAMLKLLAWSARHMDAPRKDASDLVLILKNYLTPENTDRLYAQAAHLLEAEDFEYEAAGAWLAGHDAATQIASCSREPEQLLDACEGVLRAQVARDGRLELVAEAGVDVAAGLRLLEGVLDGLRVGRVLSGISCAVTDVAKSDTPE